MVSCQQRNEKKCNILTLEIVSYVVIPVLARRSASARRRVNLPTLPTGPGPDRGRGSQAQAGGNPENSNHLKILDFCWSLSRN
jgi:hypothetical protein